MRQIWAFLTLLFITLLLTAPIQAQAIQVSLPTTAVPASTPVTVAVTAGDLTGRGIIAFDFDLLFDPAILQIQATPIDQSGTLRAYDRDSKCHHGADQGFGFWDCGAYGFRDPAQT
ncbi:MAG: hypothetical protein IPO77_05830 [Acidobacteria bacterium]|nr:hypothetical protein [Acidobacteriota bacterium]